MPADDVLRAILRAAGLSARDASRYAVLARCAWAPELDADDAAWARATLRRWDRRVGWAVAA